eukprot:COSAG01_NODE_46553_length_399_cov_0.826667_1_plen_66_part_10
MFGQPGVSGAKRQLVDPDSVDEVPLLLRSRVRRPQQVPGRGPSPYLHRCPAIPGHPASTTDVPFRE